MSWVAVGVGSFQLVSGLQQASLIRGNAQLTQQAANLNASYEDLDSYHAAQLGYTEEARYQDVVDATLGKQKEDFAGEGVNVNYGSAAQVQTETKVTGMLNTLDIAAQARAKAIGLQTQARNTRLQGAFGNMQGGLNAGATQAQGVFGGINTAISGYSKGPGNQAKVPGGTTAAQAQVSSGSGYNLGVNTDFGLGE